jgi:acetylornithine deacetylase
MSELFNLARRLIDVPSLTGTESTMGNVFGEVLGELGFEAQFQQVDGDRRNVMATLGTPRVLLCTHMDTVGPFFGSSEDETHIHGRGACDTKGIAASMLKAAERLRDEGRDGFGLLFVVGEETTSDGARATAELGWPAEAVVVGEPTENVLASGHKGALNVELIARGRAAHSGYPELGISAIDRLTEALAALRGVPWGSDAELGQGSLNVGVIAGGAAVNVIAPEARAQVSIRVVDSARECEERLRSELASHPAVEAILHGASDPVQCSTMDGWSARPVSYGTDLPYLEHFGRRFLVGPGSIHDAHTDHERVSKTELVESVDVYTQLVTTLLGGG